MLVQHWPISWSPRGNYVIDERLGDKTLSRHHAQSALTHLLDLAGDEPEQPRSIVSTSDTDARATVTAADNPFLAPKVRESSQDGRGRNYSDAKPELRRVQDGNGTAVFTARSSKRPDR